GTAGSRGADPGKPASGRDGDDPSTGMSIPVKRDFSVSVLVKDARTGAVRVVFTETKPSEEMAIRTAGYRVAAWVLSRRSRVPKWARWSDVNAEAMCKFTEAQDRGTATLRELEEAAQTAPRSGVLLGLLGHYYELDGRYAEALSCYLRAVALYPRYPAARYRA